MIQLPALPLNARARANLEAWQAEIDALPDYADRVAAAKTQFSARNKRANTTFNEVKAVLTRMCQGAQRCGYCEDSVADEVEHIRPKDLYPEAVFSWDNYLYACGPCNGPKNNRFAILRGTPAAVAEVSRRRGAAVTPPTAGPSALIDPRVEDPLHFLFLDLLNTFAFDIRIGISAADQLRAKYTIEVLRLNARDYLVKARRTAFGNYFARLTRYATDKAAGDSQAGLDRQRDELLQVDHQTVWREMQRQHRAHPQLATLFAAAPEALTWG